MDADHVRNLPPSIFTTRARTAFGMTKARSQPMTSVRNSPRGMA
jgi:hypothetical protein